MTFREKMMEIHPKLVDPRFTGGVFGCPFEFSLEHEPSECLSFDCCSCWDREMPEDNPDE